MGDFDGNSVPDLAVANQHSDSVTIWRGSSDWGGSFFDVTHIPVGDNPEAIAIGEFNGDNDPDLAIATAPSVGGLDNIEIRLGGSGASFGAPTNVPVMPPPLYMETADFNNDAKPDLVVSRVGGLSVFLGLGGGAFGPETQVSAGTNPQEIAIGDFNADSDPDLAVVTNGFQQVAILTGGAGASFGSPSFLNAGEGVAAVAVDRFNEDNDLDLAVANATSGTVSILPGGPGAGFGPPTDFPVGAGAGSMVTGDFNADSHRDLAVLNQDEDRVVVLTNLSPLPQTQIDSRPPTPTNDTTPTFTYSSNKPGSTFQCSIDKGTPSFASCPSSGFTPGPLSDGNYTFRVRAVNSGLTDPTPSIHNFRIDTTPPQAAIDSGPSGPTNDNTPTWTYSSNDPSAGLYCSLDQGTPGFFPCPPSSITLGPLPEGAYTFRVRAIDTANNVSPTVTRTVKIDLTPPQVTIDSGPSGTTSDNTPRWTYSASEEGVEFECSVDQGTAAFEPCPAGAVEWKALAPASYTFRVRARDEAGNTGPEVERAFEVADVACPRAQKKLAKAKATLKTLKRQGASVRKIKKAKRKVKSAKRAKRKACAASRPG